MKWWDCVLGRREEHNIGGRKVIIVDKSLAGRKIKKTIKDIVLTVCSSEKIAEELPYITFIFKDRGYGKDIPCWVNFKTVNSGKLEVYLIPNLWLGRESELRRVIVHEVAHLWHANRSNALRVSVKVIDRLKRLTLPAYKFQTFKEQNFGLGRIILRSLINKAYFEGLAELCRHSSEGLSFKPSKFREIHSNAQLEAYNLAKSFDNYLSSMGKLSGHNPFLKDVKLLWKNSEVPVRVIGFHMAYTIFYVYEGMSLDKLSKMSPFKFIRAYEACVLRFGKNPVFSLKSGKGIIDYRRCFLKWLVAAKGSV